MRDLFGLREILLEGNGLLLCVFQQNLIAEPHAVAADMHGRAGDNFFDLVVSLAAE